MRHLRGPTGGTGGSVAFVDCLATADDFMGTRMRGRIVGSAGKMQEHPYLIGSKSDKKRKILASIVLTRQNANNDLYWVLVVGLYSCTTVVDVTTFRFRRHAPLLKQRKSLSASLDSHSLLLPPTPTAALFKWPRFGPILEEVKGDMVQYSPVTHSPKKKIVVLQSSFGSSVASTQIFASNVATITCQLREHLFALWIPSSYPLKMVAVFV